MTQWKLVPVTPDQSMCQAGQWKANEWKRFPLRIGDIWQAMLAAAPAPDAHPVNYPLQSDGRMTVDPVNGNVSIGTPAASVQPVAWSVFDKRTQKHWYTNESVNTAGYYAKEYSHREPDGSPSMLVVPLYEHPPAADVQPVAYETENELWWHDAPDINDHIRKTGIPLYRHPPAADVQDLVAALMIIAGKQRCVDSLMSNVDIALEALKKWEGK
jgi:hypothetical protein